MQNYTKLVDGTQAKTVNETLRNIISLSVQIKDLTSQIDDLKKSLYENIDIQSLNESTDFETTNYLFKVIVKDDYFKLDEKRLEHDMPDIYKQYHDKLCKGSKYLDVARVTKK